MTRSSLREAALRTALAIAGLGIGLMVSELAVRWLSPQALGSWTPGLVDLSDGSYKLKPGYRGIGTNRTEYRHQIAVNSQGLRGPELGAKTAAVCRLLALGDSFTFGTGVEASETYLARTVELLAGRGHRAESCNGGLPGMGAPQEVEWLERHGLAVEPDVVLLGVFLGNDLVNATSEWGGRDVAAGQLVPKGSGWGVKQWLYFHSHLYLLLKRRIPAGWQRWLRDRLGAGEPWSQRIARAEFEIYARQESELIREAKENTAKALDRLLKITGARDVRVGALLIPDLVQVDPSRWSAAVRELGVEASDVDPDNPGRILLDLLAQRNIPTLDLSQPFREAQARGEELYFPQDRHWTPAGHLLAASLLSEFLLDQGLVCQPSARSS